jgi:hypothetical protein
MNKNTWNEAEHHGLEEREYERHDGVAMFSNSISPPSFQIPAVLIHYDHKRTCTGTSVTPAQSKSEMNCERIRESMVGSILRI